MTREERLAQAKARTQARIVADRARLAKLKEQERSSAQKALRHRCTRVGQMAEAAGLLAWDDGTLEALFATLGTLTECPNPVGVLEGLLGHGAGSTPGADGCAAPAERVARAVPVGRE